MKIRSLNKRYFTFYQFNCMPLIALLPLLSLRISIKHFSRAQRVEHKSETYRAVRVRLSCSPCYSAIQHGKQDSCRGYMCSHSSVFFLHNKRWIWPGTLAWCPNGLAQRKHSRAFFPSRLITPPVFFLRYFPLNSWRWFTYSLRSRIFRAFLYLLLCFYSHPLPFLYCCVLLRLRSGSRATDLVL